MGAINRVTPTRFTESDHRVASSRLNNALQSLRSVIELLQRRYGRSGVMTKQAVNVADDLQGLRVELENKALNEWPDAQPALYYTRETSIASGTNLE
jgi:hypothetical protein